MRRRSLARECTLKVLYQADIIRRPFDQTFDVFWGDPHNEEKVDDKEVQEFSRRLTMGVHAHTEAIDNKISEYATNWQLKRMAIIDRNILRIGVFELKHTEDIPPKVTINECVELAKKFGDLESSKFVNGILDKIHKQEVASEGQK